MAKTKQTKVKVKTAVTKTEPPKPVTPPEPEEPKEPEDEAEKRIEQQLDDTITEMKEFKFMVRGMVNDWIDRMQNAKREIKTLKRTQKRPRPANISGPKKPCVFETPIPISDEMCEFLGVDRGTLMSRNDVTHGIHQYVVEHNLKDPENGRVIIPDDRLTAVLQGYDDTQELSYLNLQRYIKHHY